MVRGGKSPTTRLNPLWDMAFRLPGNESRGKPTPVSDRLFCAAVQVGFLGDARLLRPLLHLLAAGCRGTLLWRARRVS